MLETPFRAIASPAGINKTETLMSPAAMRRAAMLTSPRGVPPPPVDWLVSLSPLYREAVDGGRIPRVSDSNPGNHRGQVQFSAAR